MDGLTPSRGSTTFHRGPATNHNPKTRSALVW